MASNSWTSIIKHRKEWLKDKITAIQVICDDTMGVYEMNLNHKISEPFLVVKEILERAEESISLEEMVAAGRQLENTCNELLNHLSNMCSADGSQGTSTMHNVSPQSTMNLPSASSLQCDSHTVADYLQLISPAACNDTSRSENEESAINRNYFSGLREALKKNANSAIIPQLTTSQLGLFTASSDLVSSELKPQDGVVSSAVTVTSQTALDNYPTTIPSAFYKELFEKPFWGKISDVMSPSCFSVQVSSGLPLLEDLQKELNLFYTSKNHASLSLKRPPSVGEYCAVIYPNDGEWYRACVTCSALPDVIVVEYIDYGNTKEVKWELAMKLAPQFYVFPRMSICCTMSDIIPVSEKEDEGKSLAWEERSIDWFDNFVYGNIYQVEITERTTTDSNQVGVRLYCVDCPESVVPVMWNVANLMVNLKHACLKNEGPTMKIDQEFLEQVMLKILPTVKIDQGFLEQMKQCAVEDSVCSSKFEPNDTCSVSSDKSYIHSVKKSLSEKADASDETSNNKKSDDRLSVKSLSSSNSGRKPASKKSSKNEGIPESFWSPKKSVEDYEASMCSFPLTNADQFPTPISSTYTERNIINNEEEKIEKWDPMAEDFNSLRNSCSVDTENACVAVEGVDPTTIEVCRFYKRGNCWRGDKCPYSHQKNSYTGELKTEMATFSGSSIESLTLRKDSWSIVKVTHVISTELFYVHFIDTLNSMDKILSQEIQVLPDIPEELALMMEDMQQYYKSRTRRIRDLIQPCNGEMFVVSVDDFFYRGMVLDSTCGHTKAFLVDFGKEVLIADRYYQPMIPAFMHLPKQAIHCSWKECSTQNLEYETVKKFISMTDNGYFAVKVEDYIPETDGPYVVSLYHINKNGLQKLNIT